LTLRFGIVIDSNLWLNPGKRPGRVLLNLGRVENYKRESNNKLSVYKMDSRNSRIKTLGSLWKLVHLEERQR